MPILCSLETCQHFSYSGCKHPRKKENGGQFILPVFRPGNPCIWGEAKFDAADVLRALDANRQANERARPKRLEEEHKDEGVDWPW